MQSFSDRVLQGVQRPCRARLPLRPDPDPDWCVRLPLRSGVGSSCKKSGGVAVSVGGATGESV